MIYNSFIFNLRILFYFSGMKPFKILSAAFFIALLSSCSSSLQITKESRETLLDNPVFDNAHIGVVVYDPDSKNYLYDYQGEKFFVPASNTKLVTQYVAMKYLDDSLRGIQYEIINDSTVLIQGLGDPSILHQDFKQQRVIDFLKQFKNVQVSRTGFDSYLGNGWGWNDYMASYSAPRAAFPLYGDLVRIEQNGLNFTVEPSLFKDSLIVAQVTTEGFFAHRPWHRNQFTLLPGRSTQRVIPFVPDDYTIVNLLQNHLGSKVELTDTRPNEKNYIHTIPLDTILSIMMHRSDNFFAEQTLLMVGQKMLGEMNDRAAIKFLMDSALADLPNKPGWADGSGLSRYNLFTPKDFIRLLEKMKDEFGLERVKRILPTGGTGTLSSLYLNDSGYIFAKTGTLNSVVALSGYLITKKDKLLLFSVLVNNHRSSAADVRKGIEAFLTRVRSEN